METTIPKQHKSLRKPAKPRGRFYNPAKLLFFNYKCRMNAHRIAAPLGSNYSKMPELGSFVWQNEPVILKCFRLLAMADKYCFKYGDDSPRLGNLRRQALWEAMPDGLRAKYGADFGNFHKILLAASIDLDNARTINFLIRHRPALAPWRFATKTTFRKLALGLALLVFSANIEEMLSPTKSPTTMLEYLQMQEKAAAQWKKERGYSDDFTFSIPYLDGETVEQYIERTGSLTENQKNTMADSLYAEFKKEKESRLGEE